MEATKVHLDGIGMRVGKEKSHPAGILFSGGYDAEKNELFLASVMGHPGGVAAAGGDASGKKMSGLRVLIVDAGTVYWASDSMSLPRRLSDEEADVVHTALEKFFTGSPVQRVAKFEDIPQTKSRKSAI